MVNITIQKTKFFLGHPNKKMRGMCKDESSHSKNQRGDDETISFRTFGKDLYGHQRAVARNI
jgi:hypothetical protein